MWPPAFSATQSTSICNKPHINNLIINLLLFQLEYSFFPNLLHHTDNKSIAKPIV